jgi:hypothetical protein
MLFFFGFLYNATALAILHIQHSLVDLLCVLRRLLIRVVLLLVRGLLEENIGEIRGRGRFLLASALLRDRVGCDNALVDVFIGSDVPNVLKHFLRHLCVELDYPADDRREHVETHAGIQHLRGLVGIAQEHQEDTRRLYEVEQDV